MTTMPCCPALIYIESGALPVAQMFLRPLSMLAGRSYDKWDAPLEYTLITKVAVVALAIIFLPLAIPAMGLSFLALSLSSSHKEQCAALFAPQTLPPQIDFRRLATPSEDPVKEKEELENAKTGAYNFIDEISKYPARYPSTHLPLEAPAKAREKVEKATTFAEIVGALRTLQSQYKYTPSPEFHVYMIEIQSKAKKPYESFINVLKEFVTSIKAEVEPLESSPGADELKNLCDSFDVIACYDIPEYWNRIQQIAGKYESVVGHQHEMLEDYLKRTDALLITPAAA